MNRALFSRIRLHIKSRMVLRAIFCKNQAEPGSDILRFCSFLDILVRYMTETTCQNFFEKSFVVAEILDPKIWAILPKK